MQHQPNLFVIALFVLTWPLESLSQSIDFKSIKPLYSIVDSSDTKEKIGRNLKVLWLDSVIELRRTVNLNYNLEEARKWRKDDSYLPTPEDTLGSHDRLVVFSQNCHSYALEKYFHSLSVQNNLFTKWTVVTENVYMEKVLASAFKKVSSQPIKNKKCKSCTFTPGSILVFRNKGNSLIHSVYYDGLFHSKYGGWKAKAEATINPVIKTYWDSVLVEEYHIDLSKIATFMSTKSKS